MNRLLRTYLPSSAIAFTIVILFNAVYNTVLGNNYALSGVFVLEPQAYHFHTAHISRVRSNPFQSERAHQITFFAAEYAIVIIAGFVLNWTFSPSAVSIHITAVCVYRGPDRPVLFGHTPPRGG